MVLGGIDHVRAPCHSVVGRFGIAEIVEGNVSKTRPLLLKADQGAEPLPPVEVRVREDLAAAARAAGQDIEVCQLIRVG